MVEEQSTLQFQLSLISTTKVNKEKSTDASPSQPSKVFESWKRPGELSSETAHKEIVLEEHHLLAALQAA